MYNVLSRNQMFEVHDNRACWLLTSSFKTMPDDISSSPKLETSMPRASILAKSMPDCFSSSMLSCANMSSESLNSLQIMNDKSDAVRSITSAFLIRSSRSCDISHFNFCHAGRVQGHISEMPFDALGMHTNLKLNCQTQSSPPHIGNLPSAFVKVRPS